MVENSCRAVTEQDIQQVEKWVQSTVWKNYFASADVKLWLNRSEEVKQLQLQLQLHLESADLQQCKGAAEQKCRDVDLPELSCRRRCAEWVISFGSGDCAGNCESGKSADVQR
jgi:hypothetical protein